MGKKEEGTEENYITTFNTVNLDLFANVKKLFLRLSYRNVILE